MKEGDVVRSDFDGKAYTIAKIVNSKAVLKAKDSEKIIITEIDSLNIFYKQLEKENSNDISQTLCGDRTDVHQN